MIEQNQNVKKDKKLNRIVEFTDDTALMDQAACAGGACEIV